MKKPAPGKVPSSTYGGSSFAKRSSLSRPMTGKSPAKNSGIFDSMMRVPVQKQQQVLEEQRFLLRKNEREINKLRAEKEHLSRLSTGHITTDDIMRKIKERNEEVRDMTKRYEEVEANFIKNERIFNDSKAYLEELLKQSHDAKMTNQLLEQKNMQLHIKFSQTKSMESQLADLEKEKSHLETAIRNITSEPFLNREKGGQSALKRIAELEEKLIEKDKHFKALKEEEYKKQTELKTLMPLVERLKGERDVHMKENKQLKEKFQQSAANLDEYNVYQTLFKMDPSRYAQAINDLNQKPESYPIWAKIDFLERGNPDDEQHLGKPTDTNQEIKKLKFEIMKLRLENKDFAAELEKAQNLLHLQKDIERDNTQYYEAEKQRLFVMQRSTAAKAEELARRADEKQRQMQEMSKKLGMSQIGLISPKKEAGEGAKMIGLTDKFETQSEFSAVTNESEIRSDENVLDLVIQDAEFYYESFKSVMTEKELQMHQKTLITFVTVDFYNHDTETSQLAEGYRPLYNTQFSFKNKIDDFYVQFLQKQTMKLDVYISKNNAAVLLGHAEVNLRGLIERETAVTDASFKTPVIQETVRVFQGKAGLGQVPLGSLKFKMRMRRPVGEAVRYYREKNEIDNMKAFDLVQQRSDGTSASRKKLITIQIVGCKDLVVKYGEVSNISPFFYYQFYDFDERYSSTAVGKNPQFDDTQTYEIIFDAKMVNYLQRECLEVILFDDNAPITGIERGAQAPGEQADDMIGTVSIPLADLVKGASIYQRFPIRKQVLNGGLAQESVGVLEAKISIIDLDIGSGQSQAQKNLQAQQQMLHYNKQWERELIYRIAKRLAKLPGDVETLFGIFTRGQKTVTKEDFKYVCLKRLQLGKDIAERELDMFFRGNPRLLDKNIIDLEDFLMLFTAEITQARHDMMDEEAMQYQTIKRYELAQQQKSLRTTGGDMTNVFKDQAMSGGAYQTLSFSEQEIIEILGKIRAQSTNGGQHQMIERIKQLSQNGTIPTEQFIMILMKEGNITQYDAGKVSNFFSQRGQINVLRFEEYLIQSLQIQSLNSAALQKFLKLVKTPGTGESIARFLQNFDIDKDGQIRLEGFKASMLAPEIGLKVDEITEIFLLLQKEGMFNYRDYLIDMNPSLRTLLGAGNNNNNRGGPSSSISQNNFRSDQTLQNDLMSGRVKTHQPVIDTSLNESRMSIGHQSSGGIALNTTIIQEDPKLRIIKNNLKQYMQSQDITLQTLFKLIDSNSDQNLSMSEFKQKMKALQTPLDDFELQTLFQHMDKANKGFIDYQMFSQEFPEISIQYMIKKIKGILFGSKVNLEGIFIDFCTDKLNKRMNQSDFKRFVKKYIDKAADHEIDLLFKHFAHDFKAGLSGQLTFQDFNDAFGREVRDVQGVISCSIEDIIKPLQTKIVKHNVNISLLFEKYDKNQNRKLSAEELANALQKDMKTILAEDEIAAIKQYFRSMHNSTEINELDFISLLKMKFTRIFDEADAKRSLTLIKQRLNQSANKTAKMICQEFDAEGIQKLSLRNFKHALHSLKVLTQPQIDNLTKYLDVDDDGFISVDRFDVELRGVYVSSHTSNQAYGSNPLSQSGSSHQLHHSMSMGAQSNASMKQRSNRWQKP